MKTKQDEKINKKLHGKYRQLKLYGIETQID